MWSCLCKMCHRVFDNFPQRQHQQCRITLFPHQQWCPTHNLVTANECKWRAQMMMSVIWASKVSAQRYLFCFTNCPSQLCYYRHRPPCSGPPRPSSHCPSSRHPSPHCPFSSHPSSCCLAPHCLLPTLPPRASARRVATGSVPSWQRPPSAATPHSTTNPPTSHCM